MDTNFGKSSVTPIRCTPEDYVCAGTMLSCSVAVFPITYLGLPLSVWKIPTSALMPLVERMAKRLATWQASLLSRGERLALVRHVLSAMPVHILLAMALSPPILKLVTRIIRDLIWHGRREARAGNFLVGWAKICRPLELGGLGVRDLQRTGTALRVRWLWLRATDLSRPWHHLPLPADKATQDIFRASTSWTLGDGKTCKFWLDHWIDGRSIREIAPTVFSLVPCGRRNRRLVCEGLHLRSWVQDIQGALGVVATIEYISLWQRLHHVTLTAEPGCLRWRWTDNGVYTASSCYMAMFQGSLPDPHWSLTWKGWAPTSVKFFLWLAHLD